MGIYSSDVEKLLLKTPMLENPLFKYDNYTYHIQLFMVDKETLRKFNETKYQSLKNNSIVDTSSKDAEKAYEKFNDPDAIKVVIAESGVTNVVSINDLTIKTVPAFGDNKTFAASGEFKLKLTETAGNGLVNKMHILASLLGYKSYISTPVFITVWFTGYNNTDREKPVDKITQGGDAPIALPRYTYQLIISEVNTNVEEGKTTYDMTLYPAADTGLQTDFAYMNNAAFSRFAANDEFSTILRKLQEAKNEELRKLWSFYNIIYPDGRAFEIKRRSMEPNDMYQEMLVTDFPEVQNEQDLMFLQEGLGHFQRYKNLDRTPSNNQKKYLVDDFTRGKFIIGENELDIYKSAIEFMSSVENGKRLQKIFDNINKKKNTNFKRGFTTEEELKNVINAQTEITYGRMTPEELKNKKEGLWPGGAYKPSSSNNICSIISEIWRICCPKSDYIPAFSFVPEYVRDFKNKSFYKVTLYVWLEKYPGLKDMIEGTKKGDYYDEDWIESKQINYLMWCYNNFALLKRYHYLLNGKDTSVLSYNTKEDLFWYLNASNYSTSKAGSQTPGVNDKTIKKLESEAKSEDLFNKLTNDMIKDKIKSIRNNNINNYKRNKDINIDDITNLVTAEEMKMLKGAMFRASQLNDLLIYLQTQKSQDDDKEKKEKENKNAIYNDEITNSLIAANNFLTHGQKLQLKMKILGDPYWLGFSSENIPLLHRALPHLVMCIKTFTRLNEYDDPIEDKDMEINTVYVVTSITSMFSDGTFTQELEGSVPPPFVQEDTKNKVVPTIYYEDPRATAIHEAKDGSIINLTSVYDSLPKTEAKINLENGRLTTYLQSVNPKSALEKINDDIANKWKEDSLKKLDSAFEKFNFKK